MRKLLTIIFVLIAYLSTAQTYTPMTAAGYQYKRVMADSTLHIPNFCGVPTLRDVSVTKSAIAADTCNKTLYFYDAKTRTWNAIGGGVSNISIITDSSISICNFNSCDTFYTTTITNIQTVRILNDSTLLVCDSTATCDTLNIPRAQFAQTLFDTSAIYTAINSKLSILDTIVDGNPRWMAWGNAIDTFELIPLDTLFILRHSYKNNTVVDDTLQGIITRTNINYYITNIATALDSLRQDTTFALDRLRFYHDPNSRNDSLKLLVFVTDTIGGVPPPGTAPAFYVLQADATWGPPGNSDIQNGIISGGRVTWIQDYVYNVSEAFYRIDGVNYHSLSTNITLDAADPTDDRIDLFLLTTTNTAIKLTGTAGSGIPPDYDASLYLQASFALVTAGTTQPPGVVNNWIYQENNEWTTAVSVASINPNSTNNPFAGTKTVEGTNVANSAYINFTSPTPVNMALYNTLTFQIRSKGNFQNNKKIVIRAFSAPTTATGNNVVIGSGSYGFISTVTASYQTISIPLSDFGTMVNANAFRFTQTATSGTGGWYIDNIQLQNVSNVSTGVYVTDITKNAGGDSFYVWKDATITRRLIDNNTGGGGSVTTADSVIVATASQTVFPFTSVPASKDDFFITVWGVLVDPDLYTISGGITFLTGLSAGDKVRYHRHK